jgi:hypothetical protein
MLASAVRLKAAGTCEQFSCQDEADLTWICVVLATCGSIKATAYIHQL